MLALSTSCCLSTSTSVAPLCATPSSRQSWQSTGALPFPSQTHSSLSRIRSIQNLISNNGHWSWGFGKWDIMLGVSIKISECISSYFSWKCFILSVYIDGLKYTMLIMSKRWKVGIRMRSIKQENGLKVVAKCSWHTSHLCPGLSSGHRGCVASQGPSGDTARAQHCI